MAQARYYSSTAQPTVLTSGITAVQTTINVLATTGFPASVPYILALDYNTPSEEIVLVTAAAGTTLTVTRAYDGTSGTTHNSSAGVRHTWTAKDGNDSRAHEAASVGVHGISGLSSVVGTTDVQTLSNKTLTAPVVNGGSISGSATINTTSTIRATGMASSFAESVVVETISSTSYTGGASPLSTTVTAPPSGKIHVVGRSQVFLNSSGPILFSAIQAVGSSSGTLRAASDATAAKLLNGVSMDNITSMDSYIVSGATPGETVTLTWMFRVTSTAAQIDYRNISAIPLIG